MLRGARGVLLVVCDAVGVRLSAFVVRASVGPLLSSSSSYVHRRIYIVVDRSRRLVRWVGGLSCQPRFRVTPVA